MIVLKCKSLGEAWVTAMKTIMCRGEIVHDDDVKLKEICNFYITLENISDLDPIILRYADKNRVELMKKKYSTCGLVGDYKIDYGSYIYNNNGINQIEWIINRIRNKNETKSATITLHKPGEEKLACLSLIDFKYRNNMLDMTVVYRSQNVFWSQPGNMLALRRIQNDVATALGYNIGCIELVIMSAHIYEDDFNKVNNILNEFEVQLIIQENKTTEP